MPEPGLIQLTHFVPHPPAKVWAALTDQETHARWWAAGDIRPVVGSRWFIFKSFRRFAARYR